MACKTLCWGPVLLGKLGGIASDATIRHELVPPYSLVATAAVKARDDVRTLPNVPRHADIIVASVTTLL